MRCVGLGTALTKGAVEDQAKGPGNRDAVPALIISDRFAVPDLTPSDARTVSGYVPIAAVPGFTSTSPLFALPGCTNVAEVPVGTPLTLSVTFPIVPLRTMLAVTPPIDPPAGTVIVALDS